MAKWKIEDNIILNKPNLSDKHLIKTSNKRGVNELIPGRIYYGDNSNIYIFIGYGDWKVGTKLHDGNFFNYCNNEDSYIYIHFINFRKAIKDGSINVDFKTGGEWGSQSFTHRYSVKASKKPLVLLADIGEFYPSDYFDSFSVSSVDNSSCLSTTVFTKKTPL